MKDKSKKAGHPATDPDEIRQLAKKLDQWAQDELPENQQILLRQLLSRCEGRTIRKRIDIDAEIKIGGAAYVSNPDIGKAVMDVLAPMANSPAAESMEGWPRGASGWPRGASVWPRADSWPRTTWMRSSWPRSGWPRG